MRAEEAFMDAKVFLLMTNNDMDERRMKASSGNNVLIKV